MQCNTLIYQYEINDWCSKLHLHSRFDVTVEFRPSETKCKHQINDMPIKVSSQLILRLTVIFDYI